MKVAVFGLGYVGTVTVACLASRGHDVCGIDIDISKVEMIAEGKSPGRNRVSTRSLKRMGQAAPCAPRPALPMQFRRCRHLHQSRRYPFLAKTASTDLRYVRRAVDETRTCPERQAKDTHPGFHSVVIRSTVPPGTVDEMVVPALPAEAR